MKNAPCYKCKYRHPGCHTEICPYGYHEWREKLRKEREAAKKAKQADAHTRDTIEINLKRAHTIRQVGQR